MCLVQTPSAKVAGKGSLQRKAFSSHASCVTAESKRACEWEKMKIRGRRRREGAPLIRTVKGASPGPLQNKAPSRKQKIEPQIGGGSWVHAAKAGTKIRWGCQLHYRVLEGINVTCKNCKCETLQTNKIAQNTIIPRLNWFTNKHIREYLWDYRIVHFELNLS